MTPNDYAALAFIALWAVTLLGPAFTTNTDHRED